MSELYNVIGLIGTFLYFGSYALLNMQKVEGNSYQYIGMNLCAATCVLISLFNNWNLPSAVIQIGWMGISTFGIVKLCLKDKRLKEESQVIAAEAHVK